MGRYADAAADIETKAARLDAQMPEFAAGARRAAAIIRSCDKLVKE